MFDCVSLYRLNLLEFALEFLIFVKPFLVVMMMIRTLEISPENKYAVTDIFFQIHGSCNMTYHDYLHLCRQTWKPSLNVNFKLNEKQSSLHLDIHLIVYMMNF